MPQTMFVVHYGGFTALYADGPLAYNGPKLCDSSLKVGLGAIGWAIKVVPGPSPDGNDKGFPLSDMGAGRVTMPDHYDFFQEQMEVLNASRNDDEIQKLWMRLTELIMSPKKEN